MKSGQESIGNEALEALKQDGERALKRLFDRYYPVLVSDLRRILPDEELSKDLAQEVFVELWNRKNELNIEQSLEAYLRRAARNKALNYLKKHQRVQLEDSSKWYDLEDESPEDRRKLAEKEDMESALHDAIDRLPEKCRAVFVLSRFEKMSHKEIAGELNISTKTIENQISRALRLLKEAMGEYRNLSSIIILWLFFTFPG